MRGEVGSHHSAFKYGIHSWPRSEAGGCFLSAHPHISNSQIVFIISQANMIHVSSVGVKSLFTAQLSGGSPLPVGMRRRQHKLEVYGARPVLHLLMLNAVQLVGDVSSAHIHLPGRPSRSGR